MPSTYPGALDSFVPKTDGPGQKIMAAHVNDLQNAVVAVETELGTDPAGSLTNLKTRLAVMLTATGGLIGPQQIRTVAKTGASYTTLLEANNSISDSASNKIYTVLIFPGEYNEALTLKNWVNYVAVDPKATKILRQVTDNNVECHCYLNITIASASNHGLYIRHASSVITLDGDISVSSVGYAGFSGVGTVTINGNISSSGGNGIYIDGGIIVITGNISSSSNTAINLYGGTVTINGNVSSSAANGISGESGNITVNGNVSSSADKAYSNEESIIGTINGNLSSSVTPPVYLWASNLTINNGIITCTFNNAFGHGVDLAGGTLILQNCKIVCTHADAKSIYAAAAQNVRCMSVWANRDDHANITQLITGGFTFDADVQ